MKLLFALLALATATAASAKPPLYWFDIPSPSLATSATDDMRPSVTGTVAAVSAQGVDLAGGLHVPVQNAHVDVGSTATFKCAHIEPRGAQSVLTGCEAPSNAYDRNAQ